jgi:hypothetical protein
MFQQFLFLNWGAKVKNIFTNESVSGKSFYYPKLSMCFDAFHHFLLKLPAGHLSGVELPGQFIGGDFRIMADLVSQPESLRQRKVAAMKNSMGSGRFFMLATGTPPGIRLFTNAEIIVSAFTANKTLFPFFRRDELQAAVFIH